ncbi:DUF1819 family protein [Psychrobacter celer]|uniref:DUF1819 family protein n=1 Tax=Psychrobacter celer TaxID=306572 RepID=UPI0018DF71C4|nr:DUF1819 family protein [Psychrobacter celer]
MDSQKYNMSFTAGALLQSESVTIAKLYLELGSWNEVKDKAIANNVLQSRAVSTLKRISYEIISRLSTLTSEELILLVNSSHKDQAYLIWMAVCRHHKFIADFATEVLRERFITFKPDLQYSDFDVFFNRKCDWHSELDGLSISTKKKLRQVLFKMLREADFLDGKNNIQATILSPRLLDVIERNGGRDIMYFTVSENAV